MELQVNKLHGVTWPCLTHTPTPPHMYLSVLTQAHVYSHRHTHTDNEKNDRWGKGQPELQLYELTTITALTELTRSEQRKITSLYGLQHIKRHTYIHTQTHSHTNITSGSQLSGPRESQCHSLWGPVKEKNREIYVKTTFAYRLRVNNQTQTWKKCPVWQIQLWNTNSGRTGTIQFFFRYICI